MYHIASMQIQYVWRAFTQRRYIDMSRPTPQAEAAGRLQRAWRRYTNVRIFCYYRDLIRFRNVGDPALLLKCINPKEASLIEPAAGIHVRFRLGGEIFPPNIYYKIYTHKPLCDVGAFAPRDYTSFKQPDAEDVNNNQPAAARRQQRGGGRRRRRGSEGRSRVESCDDDDDLQRSHVCSALLA